MGASLPERQWEAPFPPLVAFDFDGTLTCRDSFRAFIAARVGRLGYALGMARLTAAAARYLAHRDRGRLKAAMVKKFLKGVPSSQLREQAEWFAAQSAERLLRPDAIACWKEWKAQGAGMVMVTASPDILVAPFARRLGADLLIGTRLALDRHGRIEGGLHGKNCRGQEKVNRLREVFGDDVRLEAAYGDSTGDLEMLAIAGTRGMRVFHGRP
jgi:phosphatidylglycerophosphatase C